MNLVTEGYTNYFFNLLARDLDVPGKWWVRSVSTVPSGFAVTLITHPDGRMTHSVIPPVQFGSFPYGKNVEPD
jgi:hypothetical protein